MPNDKHVELLLQGEAVWNPWREKHPNVIPDIRNAELQSSQLMNVNLDGADLRDARFAWADLAHAQFKNADMRSVQINDARAPYANFSGADLRHARLWGSDFREAHFNGANLSGSNLMCAQLVRTDFSKADLSECKVFGTAAWEAILEDAKQDGLIISSPQEIDDNRMFTVNSLQEAQFVQLLHHEKFRPVLDSIITRSVLLLGRFRQGGIELLRALATKLRELGYLPVIFDFPRQEDRNYTETVKTLAGLSRFVVVDLSGPSVPQELYATVPHFKIPFVPIMEKGRHGYAMFQDILEYPWVLEPILEFSDQNDLLPLVKGEIVDRAEKRVKQRQDSLSKRLAN